MVSWHAHQLEALAHLARCALYRGLENSETKHHGFLVSLVSRVILSTSAGKRGHHDIQTSETEFFIKAFRFPKRGGHTGLQKTPRHLLAISCLRHGGAAFVYTGRTF